MLTAEMRKRVAEECTPAGYGSAPLEPTYIELHWKWLVTKISQLIAERERIEKLDYFAKWQRFGKALAHQSIEELEQLCFELIEQPTGDRHD